MSSVNVPAASAVEHQRADRQRGADADGKEDAPIVQVVYQIVQQPRRAQAKRDASAATQLRTFRVPSVRDRNGDNGPEDGGDDDDRRALLVPEHEVTIPNPAFLVAQDGDSDSDSDGPAAKLKAERERLEALEAQLVKKQQEQERAEAAAAARWHERQVNPFKIAVPKPTEYVDTYIPAPSFGTATVVLMSVCLMLSLAMHGVPVFGGNGAVFLWHVEHCSGTGSAMTCERWGLSSTEAAPYIRDTCVSKVESIAACTVLLNLAAAAGIVLGLLESSRREPFPFAAMVPTALVIVLSGCTWGLAIKATERMECPYGDDGAMIAIGITVFSLAWLNVLITWVRLFRLDCCRAAAGFEFVSHRIVEKLRRQALLDKKGPVETIQDEGQFHERYPNTNNERASVTFSMLGVVVAFVLALAALLVEVAKERTYVTGNTIIRRLFLFNKVEECDFARLGDSCSDMAASDVVGGWCLAHLNAGAALVVVALVVLVVAFVSSAAELTGRRLFRLCTMYLCIAACVLCFIAYGVMQAAIDRGYCAPFLGSGSGPGAPLVVSAASVLALAPFVFWIPLCRHVGCSGDMSYHEQLRHRRAEAIVDAAPDVLPAPVAPDAEGPDGNAAVGTTTDADRAPPAADASAPFAAGSSSNGTSDGGKGEEEAAPENVKAAAAAAAAHEEEMRELPGRPVDATPSERQES
mmetsp:Transcript_14975/g.46406  ORF Transcript_14975/g.46406 Transcript_14975/m.46406 type:complete len:693 (-) Transcript_14975:147-2225(-)